MSRSGLLLNITRLQLYLVGVRKGVDVPWTPPRFLPRRGFFVAREHVASEQHEVKSKYQQTLSIASSMEIPYKNSRQPGAEYFKITSPEVGHSTLAPVRCWAVGSNLQDLGCQELPVAWYEDSHNMLQEIHCTSEYIYM